jgi:ferredoxin-NADP reductase
VSVASSRTRTLVLDVPNWPGHRAGQHVDVRLVSEDGYQAERSYSIASPPEEPEIALTVERLEEGEVSPYLADVLQPGDGLELRGPIGGYFVWDSALGGPLLLVGGGSGVVPLLSMLRHHSRADAATRARIAVRVLYSVRTRDDVIDREDLERLGAQPEVDVTLTLTRETPQGWAGRLGRVDRAMLEAVSWAPTLAPRIFVCGPTPFVEAVATLLVEMGHDPLRVHTERFGPTG